MINNKTLTRAESYSLEVFISSDITKLIQPVPDNEKKKLLLFSQRMETSGFTRTDKQICWYCYTKQTDRRTDRKTNKCTEDICPVSSCHFLSESLVHIIHFGELCVLGVFLLWTLLVFFHNIHFDFECYRWCKNVVSWPWSSAWMVFYKFLSLFSSIQTIYTHLFQAWNLCEGPVLHFDTTRPALLGEELTVMKVDDATGLRVVMWSHGVSRSTYRSKWWRLRKWVWIRTPVTLLSFEAVSVDIVVDCKYLGVFTDCKLDWTKVLHILYLKQNRRCGVMWLFLRHTKETPPTVVSSCWSTHSRKKKVISP